MKRIAGLDLGSNTFLMLIAEVGDGGPSRKLTRVLADELRVVKLGQELGKTGRFHSDALARADQALGEFAKLIRRFEPCDVIAVATSAARDAKNRAELVDMAKRHGIALRVISGTEEARITFLGATYDQPSPKDLAVVDVGGGSTEIVINSDQTISAQSIDVGSVRMSERFFKNSIPTADEMNNLYLYLKQAFHNVPKSAKNVIAVAGTPTSLACLELKEAFDENKVHGKVLTLKQIRSWIDVLYPMPFFEREALPGMPKGRADVLVAGSAILAAALEAMGVSEVKVSTGGVRYGVVLAKDPPGELL